MRGKGLAISLFAGLAVWAIVLWPLPKNFSSAIPYRERSLAAEEQITPFVPGDHIQLLYHFWLFRDMLSGKTPPCANIYEFNTDGDEARYRFDTFYFPFSAIYAAISSVGTNAAGWNCAILFSHLLGIAGIYLLSRRISGSSFFAAVAAVASSAFPYRWIAAINGSPTGFAIAFVPWLFYGAMLVFSKRGIYGGIAAGLAVFLSYCSDLHVFYFSALALPLALAAGFLQKDEPVSFKKTAIALLPVAAFSLLAVILSFAASANLDNSTMSGGRTLGELALFSPIPSALVRRGHLAGASNHIFLGISALLAIVPLSLVFAMSCGMRRKKDVACLLIALAAVLSVLLLSFGTNGPFNALPIKIARKLIPKYSMIRQSAKIFCLLPTLSVMLFSILYKGACRQRKWFKPLAAISLLLSLCAIIEQTSVFRIKACKLPASVPAYEAAKRDSHGNKNQKALAVTLWPGDSHWSSVYEYGIMHSSLRLLNGYSPSVPKDYSGRVFAPLSSVNEGILTGAQIDLLDRFNVGYLLFHEFPYPGNVAPFPAGVALQRLKANKNLRLIEHTGGIAAFRIEQEKHPDAAPQIDAEPYFYGFCASFHWDGKKILKSLDKTEKGQLDLFLKAPVAIESTMNYLVLDESGKWHSFPMTKPQGECVPYSQKLSGPVYALLANGTYPDKIASPIELSPDKMFHSGSSALGNGKILFKTETTPAGIAMEGPRLPIPCGKYVLEVASSGGKPSQSKISVSLFGAPRPLVYGSSDFDGNGIAKIVFEHLSPYPVNIVLSYGGRSDLVVEKITIAPVSDSAKPSP